MDGVESSSFSVLVLDFAIDPTERDVFRKPWFCRMLARERDRSQMKFPETSSRLLDGMDLVAACNVDVEAFVFMLGRGKSLGHCRREGYFFFKLLSISMRPSPSIPMANVKISVSGTNLSIPSPSSVGAASWLTRESNRNAYHSPIVALSLTTSALVSSSFACENQRQRFWRPSDRGTIG